MSVHLKPKIGFLILITYRWICLSLFDFWNMIFEFLQFLIKKYSTHRYNFVGQKFLNLYTENCIGFLHSTGNRFVKQIQFQSLLGLLFILNFPPLLYYSCSLGSSCLKPHRVTLGLSKQHGKRELEKKPKSFLLPQLCWKTNFKFN